MRGAYLPPVAGRNEDGSFFNLYNQLQLSSRFQPRWVNRIGINKIAGIRYILLRYGKNFMLSLIHRLLRNLINSIQFNSDGFSNENLSSAFPNRLDFNLIRKKAVSSTSQPGYRMIAA